MDVLVCAAQVPFMRGGLEMLVDNLVEALRAEGHRAEAVRVPAAWDEPAVSAILDTSAKAHHERT